MQGLSDHFEVKMIRHGNHNHVARSHRCDHLFVQLGKLLLRRLQQGWMRREILSRKGFPELPIVHQGLQGRTVQGADVDLADDAGPLQVV
jgi:hypothetical protein